MAAIETRPLRRFVSRSSAATEALGECLGRGLGAGSVLALDGELGSGKTCFVRGLARGLGVQDSISSPTYTLLQSYAGRLELHHFDAWMEGRERAFLVDGGSEWLDGDGVAAIEWSSRVADLLPPERLELCFTHVDPKTRAIALCVRGTGTQAERLRHLVAAIPVLDQLEETKQPG